MARSAGQVIPWFSAKIIPRSRGGVRDFTPCCTSLAYPTLGEQHNYRRDIYRIWISLTLPSLQPTPTRGNIFIEMYRGNEWQREVRGNIRPPIYIYIDIYSQEKAQMLLDHPFFPLFPFFISSFFIFFYSYPRKQEEGCSLRGEGRNDTATKR